MDSSGLEPKRLGLTEWAIIVVAVIGFAFDIYELLMMPLIAGPALAELLKVPLSDPKVREWIGYIFWGSAMSGGVFGLLGGWLTDRFGRRRVLVWSILIYSFSALAAGFSTSAPMLLFFRCTTFIGVCVEFVAAVAWLAELFPHPRQREKILGFTQAFSSVGGLLVTGANMLAVKYAASLPAIYGAHSSGGTR
jgi:MFS family permease